MRFDSFRRASLVVLLGAASLAPASEVAQASVPGDPPEPAAAAAPLLFTQISLGSGHSCGLQSNGNILCWGEDASGQLGDDELRDKPKPVQVIGINGTGTSVAAGGHFTCAVRQGGAAVCWGSNNDGQLGDGTTTDKTLAIGTVSGLDHGVAALSAGGSHTCAITTGGGVKCWGLNSDGQLGDGTITGRLTPVDVTGLSSGVVALATGNTHTCALTTGGGVKCWGSNWNGELGDGTTTGRLTPVAVTGLASGVAQISAQGSQTCARMVAGGVKCWGYVLDVGGSPHSVGAMAVNPTPTDLSLPGPAKFLSVGDSFACVVLTTGAVDCWGSNWAGQIGDGTAIDRANPTQVYGLTSGVASVSAGNSHVCALLETGVVECWGDDAYGEIGYNESNMRAVANEVTGLESGAASVAIGYQRVCAIVPGATVKCWGSSLPASGNVAAALQLTPVDLPTVTGMVRLTAGADMGIEHTCGLTLGGGVQCWGRNSTGQLGDATTTDRSTPVDVIGLTDGVLTIDAGGNSTCALLASLDVECWGYNGAGQLGDGTQTQRNSPVKVIGLDPGAQNISVGSHHACALLSPGGRIQCWGGNESGQLGDGRTTDRYNPVNVEALDGEATAIAAGYNFTCALLSGHTVRCWGDNAHGQLGDGTHNNSSTPVDVTGITNAVAIAAGDYHACALTQDGGVKCWGAGTFGQLGNGSLSDSSTPVDAVGLSAHVTDISAGGNNTCVLVEPNDRPKCFGWNGEGELGIGRSAFVMMPVTVLDDYVPVVHVSYSGTGHQGSVLTLTGTFFGPGGTLTLKANNVDLAGSLTVTETGEFVAFLDTTNADPGGYLLLFSGGGHSIVTVDNAQSTHSQEGGGTVFTLPAGVAGQAMYLYLPGLLLRR